MTMLRSKERKRCLQRAIKISGKTPFCLGNFTDHLLCVLCLLVLCFSKTLNKNDVMFCINLPSISQKRRNRIICSKYLLTIPLQQLSILLIFHGTLLLHYQPVSGRSWSHYCSQLQGWTCDHAETISPTIGLAGPLAQSVSVIFYLRITEPEEDMFLPAVLAPCRISR